MPLVRRLALLLSLSLLLAVAGCSSLGLAYQQLPLAASLWMGRYLDLDSPQRQRLREQLRSWQAWHRREELPQWLALLQQAHHALEGGVSRDELAVLEGQVQASAERCLQQAAPLAAPLLAGLRPAQWQHLQRTLDEKSADWRARQAGPDAADERAQRYTDSLERWLGGLDRRTRREARAEAARWPVDPAVLVQGRAERQARTVQALQAWAQQDLAGGTALLLRNLQPLPAEQAYREQALAGALRLINGLDAEQRQAVHRHWRGWERDLRQLQAGG